jgi:imidazole glycerol-phosphate synthase subunit HisH
MIAITGTVRGLPQVSRVGQVKVPHMGWSRVEPAEQSWGDTPLRDVAPGHHMYFVHSYYLDPDDRTVIVSATRHGDTTFCSSLLRDNVFACQFHPERSGPTGLSIYKRMFAAGDDEENADAR